jgi:hypothetical protein
MKLILSSTQKFIDQVDLIRYQNWKIERLSNRDDIFITTINSPVASEPLKYNLYVQDLIFHTQTSYSNKRLETRIEYLSDMKNWILISINSQLQGINTIIPFELSPLFTNLIEGNHNAKIIFEIKALNNQTQQEEILSSYVFDFSSKVFPIGHFYSPLSIHVNQTVERPLEYSFEVSGNNWEVQAPRGILFKNETGVFVSKLLGSGYRRITFYIDHNVVGSNLNDVYTIAINYVNTSYSLFVYATFFNDYAPKNLVFNASNGLIDNPVQKVFFAENGDYTLRYPYWLKVTKMNVGNFRGLEVELPSADNFGTGQFNSSIVLAFANRTISIPVLLNAFDGFNLGLKNNEVVFAETTPMLQFYTNQDSSHLEIDFVLDDGNQNLFNFLYRIPYFNRRAEFSIAEILRRQIILDQYFEANFSKKELPAMGLTIKEKKGDIVVKEYNKQGIYVLNGYKPKKINNGYAILNNTHVERFTRMGIAVINVISPAGHFSYSIRVNNEIVSQQDNVSGALRSVYLKLGNLNVVEGDLVEFILHTPSTDIEKPFVITPDTSHSNTIYFKNAHGLISSIECTGEIQINLEKKRKLEKYSDNGDYKTRSYIEDSVEKMIINTGYLLQDQIAMINDLLNSTEAFFYQGKERFMLIPTTEKITKHDTTTFLNSFQLELIINDIDYAPIYF